MPYWLTEDATRAFIAAWSSFLVASGFIRGLAIVCGARRQSAAILKAMMWATGWLSSRRDPWRAVLILAPFAVYVSVWIGRPLYEHAAGVDALTRNGWIILPSLILAVLLFWLRKTYLIIYGSLEVMVGITTISVATQIVTSGSRLLSFASGVYVIIRGMDNIDRGTPARIKGEPFRWFKRRP